MDKKKKISALFAIAIVLMIFFMISAASLAEEDDNSTNSTDENEEPESTIDEENAIFAQWIKEGDSFTVSGKLYSAAAGDTTTSAIIMGEEGVFVIDENTCKMISKLNFCLKEFQYSIGGDVVIHGSDTMRFYLVVLEPGPVLKIEREIDNDELMVGDSGKVTIDIINSGSDPATGMEYTEIVPPEFDITNTYGLEQYGNTLKWTGAMPAEYTKSFSYNIRAKERYSGTVTATLKYKVGEAIRQMTSKLGMRSKALWNINLDADKTDLEVGEETRFYVLLENAAETDQDLNLSVEFPSTLSIEATHFNSTYGNTVSWNGTLPTGEERKFATAVKVKYPGVTQIKTTATGIGGTVVKYFNFTIATNAPQIFFVHNDIYAMNKSQVKIYIKNIDTYSTVTNLEIKVQSALFSAEGTAKQFRPKEYSQMLVIDFTPNETGSYPVTAELTYKMGGQTLTTSKTENIKVIDSKPAEETPKTPEPAENATKPAENTAEDAEKIIKIEDMRRKVSMFETVKKMIMFWEQ
jgi:hypothetical protein